MLEIPYIILLILLGIVAGFCAGLMGIGGGMIMVPFLTMIFSHLQFEHDYILKMAIATSMTTICFTALSSIRAHRQKGAVDWYLFTRFTPGIMVGSFLSSAGVFALIKGDFLSIFFALFVGYSAYRMISRAHHQDRPYNEPKLWVILLVGVLVGFLSGLVGAGGGFLMVPFLIHIGVSAPRAVGTSAATGFPIALFNAMGYIYSGYSLPNLPEYSLGYIYLPALVIISLFSVCMAPMGARLAHKLPVPTLKKIIGYILFILAFYMFLRVFL